jgi:rubrerythrin
MNIESVFRPLADLERSLADLYTWYSEIFAENPEAAFTFFKLAAEEKGHASLVDYQRRMVQKNQALAVGIDLDLEPILRSLSRIKGLRTGPPPTLAEAVRAALALEENAAEMHYRNVLKSARPEIARLLDSLGGEDRVHVARLTAFAVKNGLLEAGA